MCGGSSNKRLCSLKWITVVFCFLVWPAIIKPPDFYNFSSALAGIPPFRFALFSAIQPVHLHCQFALANPQSWKILVVQKGLCAPVLEICNASASCSTSIISGMASNGSLLIIRRGLRFRDGFPFKCAARIVYLKNIAVLTLHHLVKRNRLAGTVVIPLPHEVRLDRVS